MAGQKRRKRIIGVDNEYLDNMLKKDFDKQKNRPKENITDNIVNQLQYNGLTKDQAKRLRETLLETLDSYDVQKDHSKESVWDTNLKVVEEFIQSKRVQNCSKSTLYNYSRESQKLLKMVNKPYWEITSEDVRKFLDQRKQVDGLSNRSIHNIRMYLLSFFKYLQVEEKITKNPMDNIGAIKLEKKVVEYLTDEEIEMIRCAATSERDLAIIDILAGSGMRVSELCGLDISDVDLEKGEMKVYGKGAKERICYLTGRAKVHLKWYLETRTDDNPALIVTTKKPYTRLNPNGIQFILKETVKRSRIPNVRIYPHKFRKTLATQMINRGADIDQVRRILGHTDSQTTIQCYTNISNETTKYEHKKYVM